MLNSRNAFPFNSTTYCNLFCLSLLVDRVRYDVRLRGLKIKNKLFVPLVVFRVRFITIYFISARGLFKITVNAQVSALGAYLIF